MALQEFIGKGVVQVSTGERCTLEKITGAEIGIVTVKLGSYGYPSHYTYCTTNGDPFTRGFLVFEDASLLQPFLEAYTAYGKTEAARWEVYEYFFFKD